MRLATPALFALALTLAACGGEEESSTSPDVTPEQDTAAVPDTGADVTTTPDATEPPADTGGGTIPGTCGYPMPEGWDIGQVVPIVRWENVYRADGTQVTLDLEEFFCNDEWDDYSSIHFIVTTGWCPNCPNYISYVDGLGAQIEAAGGLLVFLTTETANGEPATHTYAQEHTAPYTPNNTGLRAGDGEGVPAMSIGSSPTIQFVPTSLIVRRSDMTVITDQRASEYNLPFVEIAGDPELDWSNPGAPSVRPDTPRNCEELDEEVHEPNNRIDDAKTIGAEQISGGICDSNPDFFYIDIEGPWSVYLGFEHDTGDLDVYVWDTEAQRPAQDDLGEDIGGYSTDDDEYFEHSGPAYLYIVGYNRETAPYTLLVTDL